jgi:hypothetical protein
VRFLTQVGLFERVGERKRKLDTMRECRRKLERAKDSYRVFREWYKKIDRVRKS